ncbi:alanine racemase [Marinifaba aquimaris]|uniref:alanine racemase n=1 Tax=Marinifaba aquimaris TaxID=2741323 RepID=UPI001C2D7A49|nr:alanine racemase [Marinifaba aquimaris]
MSTLNNIVNQATAEISLSALSHNLLQVKKLAPHSKVLAVCKANGYGHGLVEAATHLHQADAFGVARIQEAYRLRSGGIVKPIVLLEGFFEAEDLPHLVASNIETVVHCEEQLSALEQAQLSAPIQVWLKIDTGMGRVGIAPEQSEQYLKRLKQCSNVKNNIILMTHFACADDTQSDMTLTQLNCFEQLKNHLIGQDKHSTDASLANSAGILNYPQAHQDWVRPGILLYGASPQLDAKHAEQNFKPAMRLKSRLIAVKTIKANSFVGYGATWQATENTTIGIVAIGYGDGYPRHAKNGTPVYINGRIVPMVGRVSMDMITVDLGEASQDKNGDEVILWGPENPVETVAAMADTIPYELLCGLTSRVDLSYKD